MLCSRPFSCVEKQRESAGLYSACRKLTLVTGCSSWTGLLSQAQGKSHLAGTSSRIAASCRVFCEAAHFLQHKVAINADVAHQLVRRTILDDLSGPQNDDAIEVVNCR